MILSLNLNDHFVNDHVLKPIKVNGVDEVWSYAKQEACQHWINCLDGALALVDQEQKLDPNGGKVTQIDAIFDSK